MTCYRVRMPSDSEARRILGIEFPGYVPSEEPGPIGVVCGDFGPPCFHCGGIPDVLCDFPLGDEARTCDRSLCNECAPTVDADRNYCHEHDEHGRGMLLFVRPARVLSEPGPAKPTRARPLPKAPPENLRWRVRSPTSGAVLSGWKSEFEAKDQARRFAGRVETWDQFTKLWRAIYPLKKPTRKK